MNRLLLTQIITNIKKIKLRPLQPIKLQFDLNPKELLKKIQELTKKYGSNYEQLQPQEQKKVKWGAGIFLYLSLSLIIYLFKKQSTDILTIEEVIEKIRYEQVGTIYLINEPINSQGEEKTVKKQTKRRRIYFRTDGIDYSAVILDVDVFYDKIKQIESKMMSYKPKIIEKDKESYIKDFIRFSTSITKIVLPLIFPILIFNSSIGKIFKSKVLGQMDGFRPNIKFKDISGLGNAKIQISQLVDFLRFPQKYKKIGAKVPKGALLAGPPGTGKTMLAKACAGQADVPFFSVSGSQFVELYAGMGALRVRDLFKNAKKNTPAIIFIDEIDAIGRKRDDKFGGAHDERANTLNQLLVEMDGFSSNDDIIILAATNRKQMLDNALTRPGRFDRIVEIELPDIKGRQQILQIYLSKIKLSKQQSMKDYARRLATLTFGFSGADIANLCNQAAILAVRREKQSVQAQDFEAASERVLAGLELNLTLDPLERKKVAYHEAGHAVVAWFSEGASPLLKITIIPRSKGSLGFAQYLPNESSLMNKKQLIDQMCVILGGRMSEQFFFQQVTNGAADDLQKLRNMARSVIVTYGMSDLFPNYAPANTDGHNIFSEETNAKIDKQIINLIEECTNQTRKTVKLYKDKIEALAEAVLKKESLNHEEIKQILGNRPFQIKENYKEFLQQSDSMSTAVAKYDMI